MKILSNIEFETAKPPQAEIICSLVNSVYRGENAKKGWTTEADLLGGIRINVDTVNKIIDTNDNVILIALVENKIVGCVHLEKKKNKVCYLGMLSVDVNYQNKKVGRALMDESEDYAKNIFECDRMEMRVFERRKELIDYYLRRGYTLTERKEPFIVNFHFGEPKVKDLDFVVMLKKL